MPAAEAETALDPWRNVATAHDRRRFELFLLAAPIFARHGFKGATLRALAHACHLSPASLYHYFASKEELATYALRSPRAGWERTFIDPVTPPLAQLRQMLELSLQQLPIYLLSLRMLDEIGTPPAGELRRSTFREGEQMIGRFIHAAAPHMAREEALEAARVLIALLVGSAVAELDTDLQPVRQRLARSLRDSLVPRHASEVEFGEAFGDWSE